MCFIVGLYQTSNATIIKFINTSSSEKEDPFERIQLPVLHGLVGTLSLFLFIILIQLCRKSKSRQINVNSVQNECNVQTQPENRHSYDTITESVATVQTYRHLESEYDVIDEQVQVYNSSSVKTLSDNYEKPVVTTGTPSPTHETDDSLLPHNDFRMDQDTKQLSLCADYIDLEMNSLDRNTYIDAI